MIRTAKVATLVCSLFALLVLGGPTVAPAQQLAAELQAEVQELLTAIEQQPTTEVPLAEAQRRAEVMWRWVNDHALAGGFVPLNTTLMVGRVMNMPGGAPRRFLEQFDDDTRRLVAIADEGLLGSLSIDGPAASLAGSHQTFQVTYTVGRMPLRAGGQVLIARQFMTRSPIQVDDPAAEGYTTIRSSRPGGRFERTSAPITGPHGGFRGAVDLPAMRLQGVDLVQGDTVTITYGDRSGGSPGYQVPTYSNDAVALPVYVDHGDGLFHEFPTPTFRVVGEATAGVQGFAPSVIGVGEAVEISVRSEDRWYNRASGEVPAYRVELNGEGYGEIPAATSTLADEYAGSIHRLETTLAEEGVYRFTFTSADGAVVGKANPILVQREPELRLYWGETHGHCGFAEGLGSVDGYFRFGREDARLDYLTLSEHDIWMDSAEWRTLNEASRRWSQDGELIAYPGYEWTASRQIGGHHNVIYRGLDMPRVPTQEAPVLSALYRGLHQRFAPRDVLVIPHAHQAGDWRLSDFGTERLVEIMSGHGTFEWFGRYYLENGYQVGFVGASDDHLGHPGYSPGRGLSGQRSNIYQFGGLGGVWAPEKTRDQVFDSLRARRTVATTNSERIIVQATLNGRPMGTALPMVERRVLQVRAIGTGPLAEIAVIRGGEAVHREDLSQRGPEDGQPPADAGSDRQTVQVVFFSTSEPLGNFGSAGQPIRDNPRGHRTWSGTLEVQGAVVEEARLVGKIGPDTDSIELLGQATSREGRGESQQITFDVATRGVERVLELELSAVRPTARVAISTRPVREAGRAPTQNRESVDIPGLQQTFELSGLARGAANRLVEGGVAQDRITVRRVPRRGLDDVTLSWGEERTAPGGDWYYVRVTQVDGAVAWTSPWWVGTEAPQ